MSDAVDEILALQACYPDEGAVTLTAREEEALHHTQITGEPLECGFVFTVPGCLVHEQPVTLRGTLPVDFPTRPPRLVVHCAASRDLAAPLQRAVDQMLADDGSLGCLVSCAAALTDRAMALSHEIRSGSAESSHLLPAAASVLAHPQSSVQVWRRVFWFHHIKSPTKRRVILSAASELGLGGFSKPGFPGVIVAEGSRDALLEYTARLRALRWSAMAVRAEEPAVGGRRGLPRPLTETPGESMGLLATACDGCGARHLLLSALKLG